MKKRILRILLYLCMVLMLCPVTVLAEAEKYKLQDSGVTVCKEPVSNKTFNVGTGQALLIEGANNDDDPHVFENCVFNLSGRNLLFEEIADASSYYSGETAAKLCIGKNVTFKNCTFITGDGAASISGSNNDACINLHDGNIVFEECELTGNDYLGQFMGLYGASNVSFNGSKVRTVGNTDGWSYAMFGSSVLTLNNSTMTATDMQHKVGGGHINAFYTDELQENYDAIFIKDSVVDFSDNQAGSFSINNVNINVENSTINVVDNLGNACNSGYWIVKDSNINIIGNRIGHGWSCIGFKMVGGSLKVLHNGYAGINVQSQNSSFTNTDVKVMCNGERLLTYTSGDIWLNNHTLTLTDCNNAWLGAIGRKGTLIAKNCQNLIAYDLFNNKLKGNTETIIGDDVILGGQDEHVLFLNPELNFDYARGNTEGAAGNSNDSDLFDQFVNTEEGVGTIDPMKIIGSDAKIGTLTTAQLSHHLYDWDNGEVTGEANPDAYGVMRYACIGACDDYANRTEENEWSFVCHGTYVYAPLVGVTFDTNLPKGESGEVESMPTAQTRIMYNGCAKPPADPTLEHYEFTGWYADAECTIPVDFTETYTDNWSVLYAGWKKTSDPDDPEPSDNAWKKTSGLDDSESSGNAWAKTAFRLQSTASKTSIKLKWNAVPEADGYVIYWNKCGAKNGFKQVKVISSGKALTWTHKNRKANTWNKYYVKAYKVIDGKKTFIKTSNRIHLVTKGGNYTNVKKLKSKVSGVTLNQGKTKALKITQVYAEKNKKPTRHMRPLTYTTSDKTVATVTAKGMVKAKGTGSCYIYVTACSGVYTRVKVTVK